MTKSAFAEGAERLDRVVQSVRAQQTGECSGTHCVTEYRVSTFSPDEVWAKNYATHGIGPQLDPLPVNLRSPIERAAAASELHVSLVGVTAQTRAAEPGPMAVRVGRSASAKRPSVLRRVLFGRNA